MQAIVPANRVAKIAWSCSPFLGLFEIKNNYNYFQVAGHTVNLALLLMVVKMLLVKTMVYIRQYPVACDTFLNKRQIAWKLCLDNP